jgi:type II secretory pathway component GspD/PulD (secretin)
MIFIYGGFRMRITIAVLVSLFLSTMAWAESTINFNYRDAEMSKVLEDYAKASGQKFIIDPSTRGKVTIINKDPITVAEAFNQLSSAMALNGCGISTQEDKMIVQQARSVQRNLLEVTTDLPSIHPTRMLTWVVNLKYVSADEVNRQLRILTSKDGELVPFAHSNQLFITDWTPNLVRISRILKTLDIPAGKALAKTTKPDKPEKAE